MLQLLLTHVYVYAVRPTTSWRTTTYRNNIPKHVGCALAACAFALSLRFHHMVPLKILGHSAQTALVCHTAAGMASPEP